MLGLRGLPLGSVAESRSRMQLNRGGGRSIALLLLLVCSGLSAQATETIPPRVSLDEGFRLLYDLDFVHAHQTFLAWQQQHPADPMGPASDAAGLLFSEFDRLGVLEAQFYVDDKAFGGRKKLSPDPALKERFNNALAQAESRAQTLLAKNPNDRNGLFAMTLSAGLKADYAALIDKSNLASLGLTKQASKWAEQLLAADPGCYDAYLATGVSKYIIGSMAAPLRWILRIGGVSGDKKTGIEELQLTAQRGRYLAPFARILLAIAYVRDKDTPRARELLAGLQSQFPNNPLFALEIARLDGTSSQP